MISFLITLLVNAAAIFGAAYLLPGVTIKSFKTALWVAFLLAIVNATLGAFLNLITFGIVSFIVTVLMLMLVDKMVGNFKINGFWWAVLLAIIIGLINWLIETMVMGQGY